MNAMRRQEHAHHTFQQVVGYFLDAKDVLAEADVPEAWQPAAYIKAVELLSGKQIMFEQIAPAGMLLPPNGAR